jgi:hypothetical protein
MLEMSFKAGDNEQNRMTELAKASITANATLGASSNASNAASYAALGTAAMTAITHWSSVKSFLTSIFGD